MPLKHISLFSGMGGFDLAAQWMGWENVAHCEISPFCRRVLNYYWPKAMSYEDIKTSDFSIWNGQCDIITGGFPCQPYSTAGKRLGKEDERHLWPYMLSAIRQVRPRWVVGENVRGLTNWNGGLVFDEVQADLEAEGYEVLPFLLPACGVNAPHRRDRIWFIAHSKGQRCRETGADIGRSAQWVTRDGGERIVANAQCIQGVNSGMGWLKKSMEKSGWTQFPTQSPVRAGDDGLSSRLDGITLSDFYTESLKAAGNAIVPQVVYQIFQAIDQYESITN